MKLNPASSIASTCVAGRLRRSTAVTQTVARCHGTLLRSFLTNFRVSGYPMTVIDVAQDLPSSLWTTTAVPLPAKHVPPLESACTVDVAIIGAGIMGLSTALHLAESGAKVCVIDANEPGWGASGRHNGQILPPLTASPHGLHQAFGSQHADALIGLVAQSADTVFDLIARHRIDCDSTRAGWIQSTDSPRMLTALHDHARQWAQHGVPFEMLDSGALSRRIGTGDVRAGSRAHRLIGGAMLPVAGSVQPLSFARGLARGAIASGATVHGGSRADSLQRLSQGWRIRVAGGAGMTASQVLMATGADTGVLWPALTPSFGIAHQYLLATRPLPPSLLASILPESIGIDARHRVRLLPTPRSLGLSLRKDGSGRLLISAIGGRRTPRGINDWAFLARAAERLCPALRGIDYDYRWSARFAATSDGLPHLHTPRPGLTVAIGGSTCSVAVATALGKQLAAFMAGRAPRLPLPASPLDSRRRTTLVPGWGNVPSTP